MSDGTDFLYPFIDAQETDTGALLTDLAASALAKAATSLALQESSLSLLSEQIDAAGVDMGARFAERGRLYTFGNGGSSTDAATLAGLFCDPAYGHALPAWSLTDDQAVVTALGNDVGFELIFSRQIIAHSSSRDIAIAMSASGNSEDLLRGLLEAKRRGLLTIGFAGYDGGAMAASGELDYVFTVDSQSIHRIQESQARIGFRLWQAAQQEYAARRAARHVLTSASARSIGDQAPSAPSEQEA